jgi:hypothetical protein
MPWMPRARYECSKCWTVETWATAMNNSQDLNLKRELNLRSHYPSCGSCFHVSKDFITVRVQSSVLAFEVTISYHQSLMSRSFSGFALWFDHPRLSNFLLLAGSCSRVISRKSQKSASSDHKAWEVVEWRAFDYFRLVSWCVDFFGKSLNSRCLCAFWHCFGVPKVSEDRAAATRAVSSKKSP